MLPLSVDGPWRENRLFLAFFLKKEYDPQAFCLYIQRKKVKFNSQDFFDN